MQEHHSGTAAASPSEEIAKRPRTSGTQSSAATCQPLAQDPAWNNVSNELLHKLFECGLIAVGDTPQVVFADLSFDDIAKEFELTSHEWHELQEAGCKTEAQLQMPPPPARHTNHVQPAQRPAAELRPIQPARPTLSEAQVTIPAPRDPPQSRFELEGAVMHRVEGAVYVSCPDGWVFLAGDPDESMWPICTSVACHRNAQAWALEQGHVKVMQEADEVATPFVEEMPTQQSASGLEILSEACTAPPEPATAGSTPPAKAKKAVTWLIGKQEPAARKEMGTHETRPNFITRVALGQSKREVLTQNGAAFTIADDEPHAARIGYTHHLTAPWKIVTDQFELRSLAFGVALLERMVQQAEACMAVAVGASFDKEQLLLGFHTQPSIPHLHLHALYPKRKVASSPRWSQPKLITPESWLATVGEEGRADLETPGHCPTGTHDLLCCNSCGNFVRALPNANVCHCLKFGCWRTVPVDGEYCECRRAPPIDRAYTPSALATYNNAIILRGSGSTTPETQPTRCQCLLGCPNEGQPSYCDMCGPSPRYCPHPCECHEDCAGPFCGDPRFSTAKASDLTRRDELRSSVLSKLHIPLDQVPAWDALNAVLSQQLWPERYERDEDAWCLHHASAADFRTWKNAISKLEAIETGAEPFTPIRDFFPASRLAEQPCTDCAHGVQESACDNNPPTCGAWNCSMGGPPCYGGNYPCYCNDLSDKIPAELDLDEPVTPQEIYQTVSLLRKFHMEKGIAQRIASWNAYDARVAAKAEGRARCREWKQQERRGEEAWAALQAKPSAEGAVHVGGEGSDGDGDGTSRGIWRPMLTSTERRLASDKRNAKSKETATPPAHRGAPKRYSSSSSLANCLGHDLLRQAPSLSLESLAKPPSSTPTVHPDDSLPARELPTQLFKREFELSQLSDDFVWPAATHFAFYDDHGHIRESWAARGYICISVADRPTRIPPSANCYHFIGQVYDFVQSFPHPIGVGTSHVECGPSTWSSYKTWPEKLLDGSMREAGEELLWVTCIGDRHAAEQPYVSHEHTIGPPTQVINLNHIGGHDKTWNLWLRNLGRVKHTNEVADDERYSILASSSKDSEARMLKRSRITREVADALTASLDEAHGKAPESGRPAWQPCSMYPRYRRAFHHNIGILASMYAPAIERRVVEDSNRRAACAYILPLAPSAHGPLFLIPLREEDSVFGVLLDNDSSHKDQVEAASRFLSAGIESHHMHGMQNAQRDMVIAIPWDVTPLTHASSRGMLEAARASGAPSMWCSMDAIEGTAAQEPASFAAQRCAAMSGPVFQDNLRVGIWDKAKPAVLRRAARGYSTKVADEQAETQWSEFIRLEELRKEIMIADLVAADCGTNLLTAICADVRTAADFASEIPVPPQGLPSYHDPSLLFVVAPERPLSLHRDWLHRLPPQALPPGFHKLRYHQHLRPWARRMIATAKNRNAAFDAFCITHGHAPPGKSRSKSFTLGRGAAHDIPHADGIGTYNPLDLMLETICEVDPRRGEWLDAVDFTIAENRKWIFDKIANHIGTCNNQELMSFLFHGVRWKLEAPRQIRCSKNLQRLDDRAQKVVDALLNLEKRGYVSIKKVAMIEAPLDAAGPIPFIYLPQFECGIGGIDKEDGTARIVGDQSDPHDEHRERNSPHGEPDGPIVISFNDLSGPKGAPKDDYTGPMPFPEPEPKPRPRHKYTGLAYLSHYAHLNESFVTTLDDDMRHFFFQFFVALEDQWLCVWYLVMHIDGVLWLVAICAKTMNMGSRNSSKIACNFAQEWLEAWSRKMDDFCEGWIPTQHPNFVRGYAERLAALGHVQARPFWAGVYTDNFDMSFMASTLAAAGTLLWKSMNKDSNIWLQDHVQYGTCVTFIGGRCVNGAGYGCVVPSKKERALAACRKALAGQLTREEYESNNSFLGHVNDICDWPQGSLQGITGPLKLPGMDTDLAVMTAQSTERYSAIITLLESRPLASFWSGVDDALNEWSGSGVALKPIVLHATDCCTDPLPFEGNADPKPHIAGFANGLFWRFKLEGEWLERHITLTEGTGTAAASLMTVPMFPKSINLIGNDATASIAAAVGRAKSGDLQVMQRTLEEEDLYQEHRDTCWVTHWKGWGNGIADALSRDNPAMARRIAAAFGIKLTEVECSENVKRFMWRTLVRTRKLGEHSFQLTARSIDGKSTLLFTHPMATVGSLIESYKVETHLNRATRIRAVIEGKNATYLQTVASAGASRDCTVHMLAHLPGGMRDVSDPPSPLLGPCPSPSASRGMSGVPLAAPPPHPLSPSSSQSPSALGEVPPPPPPTPKLNSAAKAKARALRDVPSAAEPTLGRHGSPQPTSAMAARERATMQVADVLTSVDSEYAICPSDPDKLRAMVGELGRTLIVGIPKGTKSADEWGWRKITQFCKHMGPTVRWMRPRVDSPLIIEVNEIYFVALAMFWTAQCNMDPSARRVAAFGATKAQPPSALLAVYGWRRVQRDCGRYLCPMEEVKKVLHGMCLQYKRIHGKYAFEKQQAPLLSNAELERIELACADAGPAIMPKWPPVQRKMWRFLHNYLIATGTRGDEFTEDAGEPDNIMRENFFPTDADGNELEATPEAIARMKNGELLGAISGSSKRDRLNVHWSMQKQYFEYSDVEVNNLPHAWQQYELAAPCPVELRARWPAFSIRGDPMPLTTSQASSQHRALVLHALPELATAITKPTIHSYRAILASKLAEARARGDDTITDATIQAHVRWKTLASLLSYTKISPVRFARNVTKALRTDAGKTPHPDVPEIDPSRTLQDIEAALGCLSVGGEPKEHEPTAPTSAAVSKPKSKAATTAAAPKHKVDPVGGRWGADGEEQPSDPRHRPMSAANPTGFLPRMRTTTAMDAEKASLKSKPPSSKGKSKAAAPPPTATAITIVGCNAPINVTGTDSWGLVGSKVSLPHDIWEELDGGSANCTIDHFLGPFKFKRGGTHVAYSVSIHGFDGNYAIKSSVIKRFISAEQRLRLETEEEIPHAVGIDRGEHN